MSVAAAAAEGRSETCEAERGSGGEGCSNLGGKGGGGGGGGGKFMFIGVGCRADEGISNQGLGVRVGSQNMI